jgi:hypothetical protein
MALAIRQMVGGFEILSIVGRGGMGEAYEHCSSDGQQFLINLSADDVATSPNQLILKE